MTRPEWAPATRQEQGRHTEKRILKERGARVHPMSGAGSIKADGSDEGYLYEVKDANKSYTLKGDDLAELVQQAAVEGKDPVMLVHFRGVELTARIEIEHWSPRMDRWDS